MKIRYQDQNRRRSLRPKVGWHLLVILLLPVLAGCDDLLDVTNPAQVEESDLDNPALAGTMLDSALGRFECAFVNYIVAVAVLNEEFLHGSSWVSTGPHARRETALENQTGGCPDDRSTPNIGAYNPLQQARFLAEDGARRIEAFPDQAVPEKEEMVGWMMAYAGYSTLLLGEGWCEMAFDQGPLQTREQSFARAAERFSSAISIAQSIGHREMEYMALVGRARAQLNQGNLAEAAGDAEQVPEGFVRYAEYSSGIIGSRENRIYNYHNVTRLVTTNWIEYGNLMIGDVPDHRVVVEDTGGLTQSRGVPFWAQQKYPSADSPIPIASWEEAQLIIAEARPDEAEAAINRLRSSQGLPAYEPSGDGILADVLEERRRQLFLEGHRHNDRLRHDIPYLFTEQNHIGEFLGPVTCLPLVLQEKENNPNIDS
jgi:starch-binding outer membrane protein, SusD/RagB family